MNDPKCRLCGRSHRGPCYPELVSHRVAVMTGQASADVKPIIAGLRAKLGPHARPVADLPDLVKLPGHDDGQVAKLQADLKAARDEIASLRAQLADAQAARQAQQSPVETPVTLPAGDPAARKRERNARHYAKAKAKLAKAGNPDA